MKVKLPKEGWYVIGGLGIAALFRDPLNLLLQGVVEKAIESGFKFTLPSIVDEDKIIDMTTKDDDDQGKKPKLPGRPDDSWIPPPKVEDEIIEPKKTYFPIVPGKGEGLEQIQTIAPWLVMPGQTMPRPRALEPKIPVMEDPIISKLLELAEMTRRAGGIAYGK